MQYVWLSEDFNVITVNTQQLPVLVVKVFCPFNFRMMSMMEELMKPTMVSQEQWNKLFENNDMAYSDAWAEMWQKVETDFNGQIR